MVVHTRDTNTLANRLFLSLVIRKGMFVCLSLFSVYLTSLSLLFFVSSLSLFFFFSFFLCSSLSRLVFHTSSTPFSLVTFTLHISLSFFSILYLHQEFLPWEHGPSEATGYMEQYENSDVALNRILSHLHYLFHVNLNPSMKSSCPIAIDAITLFITRNN